MSVLTQVAERVRTAEKAQRKVGKQTSHLPIYSCTHSLAYLCVSLQNVLKKEKLKLDDFFRDGISCRLPLDPAVCVKAVDLDVRASPFVYLH